MNSFFWDGAYFQELSVSFREGKPGKQKFFNLKPFWKMVLDLKISQVKESVPMICFYYTKNSLQTVGCFQTVLD